MSGISNLVSVENIIFITVVIAVLATMLTIAMPYFQNDKLNARIKIVSIERDKLRAEQKAMLSAGDVRLREKPKADMANKLVEKFNLRKLFEAETSRVKLRQAGYRSEKHLVTFLAARLVTPFALAILTFVYTSILFSNWPLNMRFVASMVGLLVGYYVPGMVLTNLLKRRQTSISRAWSNALDLLLICVESGMAMEPAMQRVAKEIGSTSVPLAEEMTLTVAELSYLQDRRKAFDNLAKRTGLASVKSVVTSLVQSEQYGTPLGQALRVLAQENRDARMSEAERKAAALPPKLTVPMILFFLPVIFVVVLVPAILPFVGKS